LTLRPGLSSVPLAARLMFCVRSASVAMSAQDLTSRVVVLCRNSRRRWPMRSCSFATCLPSR
jgi:hypothetical protein